MGTKEELLRILEEKSGDFISGSDIAKELSVSGTAIWKAAGSLRDAGYNIEAVTNKGYRLLPDSDILSEELILSRLRSIDQGSDNLQIDVFRSVDSTNDICRDHAASGAADGYIAVAANQTKGRGRHGRSFFSPAGTGLYLSMLLRPSGFSAQEAMRFTTIAAVSVCRAIEQVSGKTAGIKWVNDVFIDDLKVCGILTEASFNLESGMLDYAIVGIGINVFTPPDGFPDEIQEIAGSVFGFRSPANTAPTNIRSNLAAYIISYFMDYYRNGSADYIEDYRRRCLVIGRDINVLMPGSGPRKAHALDVDDECGLKVRYEDGSEEVLRSGEISIRIR